MPDCKKRSNTKQQPFIQYRACDSITNNISTCVNNLNYELCVNNLNPTTLILSSLVHCILTKNSILAFVEGRREREKGEEGRCR